MREALHPWGCGSRPGVGVGVQQVGRHIHSLVPSVSTIRGPSPSVLRGQPSICSSSLLPAILHFNLLGDLYCFHRLQGWGKTGG